MKIREIANKINEKSKNYNFGEFQTLRKEIKALSKKASSLIFTDQTINDEGWAFHYGGRKEIQFNIGIEEEGLRYGIAFSLETSRSLPDLSILYPKILKLNSLIRNEPSLFADYKMWHWKGKRSEIYSVREIDENLAQNGTFIFIGKIMNINNIDYDEILSTFDMLLNIYVEVEQKPQTKTKINPLKENFKFDNKRKRLPKKSRYNTVAREINVDVRHTYLQEKLYESLVMIFGEDAVAIENQINGKRIDIVVNTSSNNYIFYEVKTGSSAKQCIRQAIGQLLEYSYWNKPEINVSMIVAGEYEMDKTTSEYLRFLKNKFKLPISYHRIK